MANFCTKCGTAIDPGTQFCTACGAPANAAGPVASTPFTSTPAAFTPVAPTYVPQASVLQTSVPPSGGGSGAKVILIVVAVIVGLGILGVAVFGFTMWRISRAVRMNASTGQVTLNTPGGSITANSGDNYTPSDLGTDIYPGAHSGHGSMRMDLPNGSMVTGVFLTSDSKDQVLAFYKDKFGSAASVMDTANGAILTLDKGHGETVMVTISEHSSQESGKTQLAIVHTKSKQSS